MNHPIVKFLKACFYNAIAVFFANYLIPGVEIIRITKLPHVQGDVFFPLILGFLNALVYPSLKALDQQFSFFRLAVVCSILNFGAYAFLKLLPVSIHLENLAGYLLVSLSVTVITLMITGWEMRKHKQNASGKTEGVKFPQ